jgi:hypothetical protein
MQASPRYVLTDAAALWRGPVRQIADRLPVLDVDRNRCAALDLCVWTLASEAGVSRDTVARLERGEVLRERTITAIREALEAAGVEFIPDNGGGPGVRLRKAAPAGPGREAVGRQHGVPPS